MLLASSSVSSTLQHVILSQRGLQVLDRSTDRKNLRLNSKLEGTSAWKIYERIRRNGATPSVPTIVAALKHCSSSKDLATGRRVHREIADSKESSNIFVLNTLIDMYAKCGSIGDARSLFESTARFYNVVSWNAIIAGYVDCGEPRVSLNLFQRMRDQGFRPDARTFVAALRACAILALEEEDQQIGGKLVKSKFLEAAMMLHSQALLHGFGPNVFVMNTLVNVYGKCSSIEDARMVFDRSPSESRCLISWNTLVMGYAESSQPEEALALFERIQDEGFQPDSRSYAAAIKACASLASKEDGKPFEVYTSNDSSIKNLDSVSKNRDCSSRNFDSFSKNRGSSSRNFDTYRGNLSEEIPVSSKNSDRSSKNGGGSNNSGIKKRIFKARELERGFFLHARAASNGLDANIFVANALIDMYGKCGSMEDARRIFDAMVDRNVVSWTAMILGYTENDEAELALELFHSMRRDAKLEPDSGAYIAALKACGAMAALETGKLLHDEIRARKLLAENSIVATCVLDFYSKCGSMGDARSVFDAMPRRDLVAWNTLVAGYADQGDFQRCLEVFEEMSERSPVRPDGVTFLSLLSACGHAGLVDRAKLFFEAMRSPRFRLTPSIEHYNCMVDLLGRANQIDEAMAMVEAMPHRPNARLWTSLLSASKKWGNVRVGKIAFESLLALDDTGSPPYVLMANSFENEAS